jgi:hypothetical protein
VIRERVAPSLADQPREILEYYALAFAWLHMQLFEKYKNGIDSAMQARRSFWHLVPDGIYATLQAHELIQRYLESVERRLDEEIRKHSISFLVIYLPQNGPRSSGSQ